jgi:hypothetical protein
VKKVFARRLARVCCALALGTGALVAVGSAPVAAAGSVGYVIAQGEGECWLASVDLVTGTTERIGTVSADKCAFDLEFTPDGTRLLGTRVVEGEGGDATALLVEFDLTTGAVTTLGQLGDFTVGGPGESQGNLTLPSAGGLYTYLVPDVPTDVAIGQAVDPACDGSALCLFQGDAATPGTLTYVNSVPQTFTEYFGLATSCAGVTTSIRYAELEGAAAAGWSQPASQADVPQILTQVNLTATGAGTSDVGPVGDGVFLSSLDYDTAGTLHAVGFDPENAGPSLFTLDQSTGAATRVTTLNDGSEPINVGVLGFAVAHPCAPTPPLTPLEPPAAQPLAAVTPRFTG